MILHNFELKFNKMSQRKTIIYKKRICLQTLKEFIPKRMNQYFINRKAQYQFNNIKASKLRAMKKSTVEKLNKNWTILDKLLGSTEKVIIPIPKLISAGFHLNTITSVDLKGEIPTFSLYDVSFMKKDADSIEIKRINT